MKEKHKGLDLVGIILVYVITGSLALVFLVGGLRGVILGFSAGPTILFSLFLIFVVIMTILYHMNRITNYVLIGVLGIFGSVIGGIFILVGQPKSESSQSTVDDRNDIGNLEYRLRQLDTLLTKGVISKEEYDRKRQSIIDDH
jgi:hypothetical protein